MNLDHREPKDNVIIINQTISITDNNETYTLFNDHSYHLVDEGMIYKLGF